MRTRGRTRLGRTRHTSRFAGRPQDGAISQACRDELNVIADYRHSEETIRALRT